MSLGFVLITLAVSMTAAPVAVAHHINRHKETDMAKCSKSCACYDCRGDHTWELLDAIKAGEKARSSSDPGAAARAMSASYDKSMKARYGKKGWR